MNIFMLKNMKNVNLSIIIHKLCPKGLRRVLKTPEQNRNICEQELQLTIFVLID